MFDNNDTWGASNGPSKWQTLAGGAIFVVIVALAFFMVKASPSE